ncbi:MAG: putative transcriptional regulatory protein [Candidatus Hepatoplasma vulgare]|nr:MAG: putative transcriptional regulatory protein [Candidatus Hepatoplasma sp.]
MSGHSKWANIKHRKGSQDQKRGMLFQKLSKEIIVALKSGDKDPDNNPRLRLAIEKAKSQNVPNDNIKKLIERQSKEGKIFEEITYEGYDPSGIAILVECLSDNLNRTTANVKAIFTKNNGNLGTKGSVAYLFETKGIIALENTNYSEDKIMELLIDSGLENIENEDDVIILQLSPSNLLKAKKILEDNNINNFITTEVTKIPIQKTKLTPEKHKKLDRILNLLEDNEDVQNVFNNAE